MKSGWAVVARHTDDLLDIADRERCIIGRTYSRMGVARCNDGYDILVRPILESSVFGLEYAGVRDLECLRGCGCWRFQFLELGRGGSGNNFMVDNVESWGRLRGFANGSSPSGVGPAPTTVMRGDT